MRWFALQRNGTSAWIGLPEREATKLQELWHRDELGLEMSVEVQAPVVVGVYPMRIARYIIGGAAANGATPASFNGHLHPTGPPQPFAGNNGNDVPQHAPDRSVPADGGSPLAPPPFGPLRHGPSAQRAE